MRVRAWVRVLVQASLLQEQLWKAEASRVFFLVVVVCLPAAQAGERAWVKVKAWVKVLVQALYPVGHLRQVH